MIWTRFNAAVLISTTLLCTVVLSSCATNPVTGKPNLVFMSEDKEIELGHEANQQVLQQYRIYNDPALQDYVDSIGQTLTRTSHRPGLDYKFTIVDSDQVNAFALPGGYIYITRGLMAYLNSEAELAAVLGHEIGHVTARHAVRQHSQGTLAGIFSTAVAVGTGVQGAGDVANLVSAATLSGYGRDMELEADRLGSEYLARSGYSPEAMMDVVRILKNQEQFEIEQARAENREPQIYHGVFATHPDQDTRLKEVVQAADELATGERPDNRVKYLNYINGLAFGQSSQEGVLRDNRFFHGSLGVGLTFPKGWRLENLPDRLLAFAPSNAATIQVKTEPADLSLSPKAFMQYRLKLGALEDGQALQTEDGLQGYSATVRDQESPYGKRPVRYSVVYLDNFAYVFAGAAKYESDQFRFDPYFIGTAKSLHRLSLNEVPRTEPVKIRVIRAEADTNIDSLAANSPITSYPNQQLRLLNDLYPTGEPTPGELVKIVK